MVKSSTFSWEKLKVVGQYAWEVFSWLVIPAIFGYLAYLSIFKGTQIGLIQISLVALAALPFLLKLIARYISEFSVGPKGVSGKIRESTSNKYEIDKTSKATSDNIDDNKFQTLLLQSQKVLHTLWKFQVETFKDDDSKRWGFTVGPGNPDYFEFSLGVSELIKEGLAVVDARGFVFLTNSGLEFCKKYESDISASPFFYEKFSS